MPSNPADRRQSPRHDAKLQARLEFSVLLHDTGTAGSGVQHLRAVAGHTLNLSLHGLAVVLRAQNIEEQYLAGGDGSMSIELDLPNGLSVAIQATPVRYEKLDDGYLIGARISEMSGRDRELYEEYLREIAGS
ncbi:MAG TPA: PilZ domain-containing protein [Pyrinomonadaceae bacterium]